MPNKYHCSVCVLAALSLAACSEVGGYNGPREDMSDMSAQGDMTSAQDMPQTGSDMNTDPGDMGSSPTDMPDTPTGPAPPSLNATGTPAGIELAWSPVPDALRYEVRIDGGDWINVLGEQTYVDEEAPAGVVLSAVVEASDATRREAVDLLLSQVETEPGPERTYEVRAILADATTDPSEPATASRPTEITGYQWQYTDSLENPDWKDLDGATMEMAEDPSARDSGAERHYRVSLSNNAGEDALSMVDAGFKLAVVQVGVGGSFSCALLNNKRVRCWGINTQGQLGIGTSENVGNTPGDMPPPYANVGGAVKSILPSNQRVCVHMEDDSVRCWGQLYDNTTFEPIGDEPSELPPPPINIGAPVKSFTNTGILHQCVITHDDRVRCWGYNENGELGLGDTNHRGLLPDDFPLKDVNLGADVVQIEHIQNATCALLANSEVKCWGNVEDFSATLTEAIVGDDPSDMPPVSLPVIPDGWRAVDLSRGFTAGAMCVVAEFIDNGSKAVFCWGNNLSGQLGTGDTETLGDEMGKLPGNRLNLLGKTVKKVYTGIFSTCFLASDARAYCWGSSSFGRPALGPDFIDSHGDEPGETAPKLLDLGGSIQELALGVYHSCALMSDGEVKCWGYNANGELGTEDTDTIGEDMTTWPPPNVKLF